MEKFTVISASEFLKAGPRFGSPEEKLALATERRASAKRETLAQKGREENQARLEHMTPIETAYDNLAALCDFRDVQHAHDEKLRFEIAETWRLIEEL